MNTTMKGRSVTMSRAIPSALLPAVLTLGALIPPSTVAATGGAGSVVVRIDDPWGTHCIDSTKEQVTVYLRRVFTEKRDGLFFDQDKAGVLVRTLVVGNNTSTSDNPQVQVPAVDMVSVKDAANGRVSLALEYAVASGIALKQGATVTQSMDLLVNLSKSKAKSAFGNVIEVAGQALGQSLLPSNPYTIAANKYLKFANDTIDKSISTDNAEEIAHFGLHFNAGQESDIKKCESSGNERTGALVALRDMGPKNVPLIPMTDTEKQYCFSYSSQNTFEVTAAHRKPDGTCPDASQFTGINNDYVMLLLSASEVSTKLSPDQERFRESRTRCTKLHLPAFACGVQ